MYARHRALLDGSSEDPVMSINLQIPIRRT